MTIATLADGFITFIRVSPEGVEEANPLTKWGISMFGKSIIPLSSLIEILFKLCCNFNSLLHPQIIIHLKIVGRGGGIRKFTYIIYIDVSYLSIISQSFPFPVWNILLSSSVVGLIVSSQYGCPSGTVFMCICL